ncbi:MAG: hypothetical protein AMK70_02625 [Nitrospira bacterium SG8_35_1]|nr:MAG: hypothetical protein AMK70_02625 [Nitrospira bacterium SG8_35_1]
MKKLRFLLKILVGILILCLLVTKFPANEIYHKFSSISIGWYFLSVLIIVPFCFIKYLRWRCLLQGMGIQVPLWGLFVIYLKGIFLGSVTPGRVGELSRAWFLKDRENDLYKGLTSVFLDRLLDVAVLFLFTVAGTFIYKGILGPDITNILIKSFAISTAVILILYMLCKHGKSRAVISSSLSWMVSRKIYDTLRSALKSAADLSPKVLFTTVVLSLLSHLLWGIIGYVLLVSLGAKDSFLWLLWGMSIVAIISNLPVSYMGIGIRESAFAFFFASNNHPGSLGLSFGLLVSALWLWIGLLGFAVWIIDCNFIRINS